MFVGEEVDGRVIEFESQDVVFLEEAIIREMRLMKICNSMKWKIQIMVHLVIR